MNFRTSAADNAVSQIANSHIHISQSKTRPCFSLGGTGKAFLPAALIPFSSAFTSCEVREGFSLLFVRAELPVAEKIADGSEAPLR
jgi:hypothetical protein